MQIINSRFQRSHVRITFQPESLVSRADILVKLIVYRSKNPLEGHLLQTVSYPCTGSRLWGGPSLIPRLHSVHWITAVGWT